MKKLAIYITGFAGLMLGGCLKDTPNVDFTGSSTTAEISHASITGNGAPSGGLTYFNAATLPVFASSDPDTITYDVNIASPEPPTKDVVVTVALDDQKRIDYNATSSVIFGPQPDSTYTLVNTTLTIKAGTRIAQFSVIYFPAKIDPTQSYMLPITLTDASGITISANLSTIYFHIIGNLLAGSYTQEWIRYNSATKDPTLLVADAISTTSFVPVSPTEIQVASGTGTVYHLSFTNNNPPGGGDLSLLTDFKVTIDPASVTAAGITLAFGPDLVLADAVNHKFEFNFGYINGSGAPRNITDKFTP